MKTNWNGYSTFHWTCLQVFVAGETKMKVLEKLLSIGGSELIEITNHHGNTVLHAMCLDRIKFSTEVFDLINSAIEGKLVFMTNENGATALQAACCQDDVDLETIDRLLEAGREELVFLTDNMGHTALHNVLFNHVNPSEKLIDR